MTEAVLSLAAGRSQLPLIRRARSLGYAVVAVDQDPEAPGMELADEALVCSAHDPETILRRLAPLRGRYEVRAVATKSSGRPVAAAAVVARELGLAGLNPEWAQRAVSKPGQMEMAERAGVPVPRHVRATTVEEVAAAGLAPPLVVKPSVTRVGKAGVARVDGASGLGAAFEAAARASADGVVEVEEYVPGEDVVLAGLLDRSAFRPLVLLDELVRFDAAGNARAVGYRVPSFHAASALEAELVRTSARLVRTLELGSGVAFLSFRAASAEPPRAVLLETHFDLAGDLLVEHLFPAAFGAGFDLIEEVLAVLASRSARGTVPPPLPTSIYYLADEELAPARRQALAGLPGALGEPELLRDHARSGRAGFALARLGTRGEVAAYEEGLKRILSRGF